MALDIAKLNGNLEAARAISVLATSGSATAPTISKNGQGI